MGRIHRNRAFRVSTNKGLSTKRKCEEEETLLLLKRQRNEPEKPFRLLDFPGELRNQIYECAAEITTNSWPILLNPEIRRLAGKRPQPGENTKLNRLDKPALPFLGFTQSCSQIRSEFRGLWMECHRIPLSVLNSYCGAFFPLPPKRDRDRFDSYYKTTGQLKVFLRKSELGKRDILRLLKFRTKFPNYNLVFPHDIDVPPEVMRGIRHIANNQNPVWLKWLKGHVISQIRTDSRGNITIVVKDRYAQLWMRPTLSSANHIPKGYLQTLGLDSIEGWTLKFAVDYS